MTTPRWSLTPNPNPNQVRDDTQLVASRGGTRVFAGNLSAAVGWQQLKEHLVRASRAEGGVHTKLPSDPSGHPMGFALCDFRTAAAAETAVRMVHNTPLDGRLLFLRQARATHYGSTYYGATYYGSTYYGSTYYGSAYYGSTYYG